MIGQKLRGLVGQSMNGRKKGLTPVVFSLRIADTSWSAPETGTYMIVAVGGGGGGDGGANGGGSGSIVYGERYLAKGQRLTLSMGRGANTTVTSPNGQVMTAGAGVAGGSGGAGGTASSTNPRDVLTNGGASSGVNGGARPAVLGFSATSSSPLIPECGSGSATSYGGGVPAGGNSGEVIIYQIRLRTQ